MALNWPANPSVGDTYTSPGGTVKYQWNGTAWDAVGTSVVSGGGGGEPTFAGVERIIAGTGVTINPATGTGQVTVSSSGGGGDGDSYTNPSTFDVKRYKDTTGVTVDQAVTAAFAWARDNLDADSAPCIYFAAGSYDVSAKTLLSNGSVDSKTQITIKGEGRGDSSRINLSGTWTINQPVNISGIFFSSSFNGSSLSFRRDDTGGGAAQDDMDTTISNCVFNNYGGTSSIDVDYRGRNLELYNCRFKTGGTNGIGVKLSYFNNTGENVVQSTLGWKRILIHGNTFHNYPTAVRIENSSARLRGLVFANNTQETNGTLINSTGVVEAAAITGNTCQVNQNGTALIAFDFDDMRFSTFTSNTVFGNVGQTRYARLLNIINGLGNTITSNVAHMCDSGGGITGTMNSCRIAGNIGTAPSGSNIVNVSGTNSIAANQDVVYA